MVEQAEFVKSAPSFDDPAVLDAEDIHPGQGDRVPGARYPHQWSSVGAGGGEPFNHDVVLGDELIKVAVPVGHRRPEHDGGLPHPFRPGGCARERRVVIDEVRRQVPVDRVEVTPAEQVLDERLDEVLVGGGAFGCHHRIVLLDVPANHPNKLGEANLMVGSTLTG